MNKRIQKLFPKEFYTKDDSKLYAEISLRDLNTIIDYIDKLENYGESVGERRNQLYDKIEKAIEFINSFDYYIPEDNKPELLDILGGDSICHVEEEKVKEEDNEEA